MVTALVLQGNETGVDLGARFVPIEFKEGKLTKKQLLELVTQVGLAWVAERAELLPYQVFLVF
ncbi:MAG: hypothetical protein NT154_43450 [Verrucomicrobia bacterium]|nr:hypothetical protein [Verrucomicrobiota bacterium]